jgi:hypothetical protein
MELIEAPQNRPKWPIACRILVDLILPCQREGSLVTKVPTTAETNNDFVIFSIESFPATI